MLGLAGGGGDGCDRPYRGQPHLARRRPGTLFFFIPLQKSLSLKYTSLGALSTKVCAP